MQRSTDKQRDPPLTIVGNLTKDPELRYRPGGGEAVLRFTVASAPRYYSKAEREYVDGETTFMPCWITSRGSEAANGYLERLAETFRRGDHVIVVGDLVTQAKEALHNSGCRCGLNPPASRSARAM